jgi:hypothetical protein
MLELLEGGFIGKVGWANSIYDKLPSGRTQYSAVSDFCNKAIEN